MGGGGVGSWYSLYSGASSFSERDTRHKYRKQKTPNLSKSAASPSNRKNPKQLTLFGRK
jgi:hypothetical protein